MKTPEEIKHTLRYCWCKDEKYQCIKCPYNKENDSCDKALDADALAYIQQLEDHIRDLTKRRRDNFMRIKVVLQAYVQTAYEQYTHMFKTVEVELPDDEYEWHVAGEEWRDSNE